MYKLQLHIPRLHFFYLTIIGALLLLNIAILSMPYSAGGRIHDHLGLNGLVTVYIDGKKIGTSDAIFGTAYDYVICKVWNASNNCSDIFQSANSCSTYTGAGGTPPPTIRNKFYAKSMCSLTSVGLSTDTSAINGGVGTFGTFACPTVITTNGLSPVIATLTSTGLQNSIVLTATWTATGSQTVYKGCLFANDDKTGTQLTASSGYGPLAADILPTAPIALTNGQAFTVQWTFSF